MVCLDGMPARVMLVRWTATQMEGMSKKAAELSGCPEMPDAWEMRLGWGLCGPPGTRLGWPRGKDGQNVTQRRGRGEGWGPRAAMASPIHFIAWPAHERASPQADRLPPAMEALNFKWGGRPHIPHRSHSSSQVFAGHHLARPLVVPRSVDVQDKESGCPLSPPCLMRHSGADTPRPSEQETLLP